MREHRLYQVDWLIRKYGFTANEIPLDDNDNLSLIIDPKEMWAKKNPQFFHINVNKANKFHLLRVPGFGEITANLIIKFQKCCKKIYSLDDLKIAGKRKQKAEQYVTF